MFPRSHILRKFAALIVVALMLACPRAAASEKACAAPDSLGADQTVGQGAEKSRYDRRTERMFAKWSRLMPRRTVVQYAGGIGFLSAGVGWAYGHRDSWETDFLLGYVPPYSTGRGKLTITLRESYVPFDFKVYRRISYEPLAVSVYFNAITGHEFWTSEPVRYPHKYYGFSTGMRFGLSLGQRFHLSIPNESRRRYSDIMFYYDLNTCDLDIASFAKNSSVSLWDILNISLGMKFSIF